jgi:hypothetical protein
MCVSTIEYHTNLVPHIDNLKKEVVDSEVKPTQTSCHGLSQHLYWDFLDETAAAEQRGVAAGGWACVLLIDHMDLQCQ